MSAWTACFPFLPLCSLSLFVLLISFFSLKCRRVIGRRFERPACRIDGRWGACVWHAGLRRNMEEELLSGPSIILSPNHPVMENVQDGGGEGDRRVCVCVCFFSRFIYPGELCGRSVSASLFIQLNLHLTGRTSSQCEVIWSNWRDQLFSCLQVRSH